jgi:hypothetical protein
VEVTPVLVAQPHELRAEPLENLGERGPHLRTGGPNTTRTPATAMIKDTWGRVHRVEQAPHFLDL